MKKIAISLFSVLCMLGVLITGISAADTLEEELKTPAYTLGNWSYENGVITSESSNSVIGDSFCVTDYWIDSETRVSVSADFTIQSGALEFVFSEVDPSAPVQLGCIIVNMDVANEAAKMFTCSSLTVANKTALIPLEYGVTYHMRVEFYEDGTIEQYIDDELVCASYESGFAGAYIGVGGWNGTGTISNLTVNTDAKGSYEIPEKKYPEGTVMVTEGTTDMTANINVPALGNWDFADGKIISKPDNMVSGDSVASSYYYVSPDQRIVYSGSFTVDELSNCLGLCISEKSPEDALLGGLVIFNVNVETQTTNLYAPFAETQVSSSVPLTLEYGTTYNLRLEIEPDGRMKAYVEDVLCHEIENDTRFPGGFLGIFAFNCSGTAENLSVSYGEASDSSDSDSSESAPSTSAPAASEAGTTNNKATAEASSDAPKDDKQGVNPVVIAAVIAVVIAAAAVIIVVIKKKK